MSDVEPESGVSPRGCLTAVVVLAVLLGVPAGVAVSADSSTSDIDQRLGELYVGVDYQRPPRAGEDAVVVEGEVRDDCGLTGQWFSLDDLRVVCDDDPQPERRG